MDGNTLKPTLWFTAVVLAVTQCGSSRVAVADGNRQPLATVGEVQSSTASLPGPAVLDEWGTLIATLGAAVRENPQRTQVRTTIAQLAMFDAVNATLDGNFEPFASKPDAVPGASPEAAAIRAAYVVAVHDFPSQAASIDAAYARSIGELAPDAEAIANGVAVGEAAANAVLAKRAGDNRDLPELTGYTAGSGPGVWAPTPPSFGPPQGPFLQFVTPFGYDDPARFLPGAPPALDSHTYTADYLEIEDYGAQDSSSRSARPNCSTPALLAAYGATNTPWVKA